jgi:signal transduction histidine kinase
MAERRLSGIRDRVTSHPQIADAALGILVVGVILFAVRFGPPDLYKRALDAEDFISGLAAALLIAARRRWPLAVYAAAVVLSAAFNLHAALVGSLLAAIVICTYTVASHTSRRIAVLAGIVTVTTVYISVVIGADRSWAEAQNLSIVAWGVVAVAVGDATRSRRNNLRAVEERARQAERSRDEEARRRVVEERLRIARDLHDVVAHHIAVINVQVGVAVHLLRTEPDGAEEALTHVRQASRTVLTELSTVLDVLRSEDGQAGTEPPPGLSRLASLLDSLAAAGLRVEHRQQGEARRLPSAVDLAAYRIVQESLTKERRTRRPAGGHPARRARRGAALPEGGPHPDQPLPVPAEPRPDPQPSPARRADRTGTRNHGPSRQRAFERRNRRAAVRVAADRQDPHQPSDDEAGRTRPGAAGRLRLQQRSGPSRRYASAMTNSP